MRAVEPDVVDFAVRDGRKLGYETVGTGEPAIFLTPPWSVAHSRIWKAQVPFSGARRAAALLAELL